SGLAWRDADAAVAHHHGRDAVPRGAGDQGIPANLCVVMRMRIDEAGCEDEVARIDYFLRAVFDFANFGDAPVLDRDVAMKSGRPGSVDYRSVLDHEIVRHAYLLKIGRRRQLIPESAVRSTHPFPAVRGRVLFFPARRGL